jgi:hypothetical protein
VQRDGQAVVVDFAVLADGDEIALGDARMRYVEVDEPATDPVLTAA